jgi:heterodisulfide reductase subunit C
LTELQRKVIKIDELDKKFLEAVMKAGAEKINLCIQCGTCTASCPSGLRTAFRTRQLMRRALLGFKEPVLSNNDVWLCTTCFTCLERCPRGVDPTDVILVLRNMAVKEGYMLDRHRQIATLFVKTGHAAPINDANRERRVKLGLTEVPPTTHMFPDALVEVQEIVKRMGFDKLVGYEWK